MAVDDQELTEITVRFLDGTEEARYVPGLVGDCVRLIISWKAAPVMFTRNHDGIYVEDTVGKCADDVPRPSRNGRRRRDVA